MTAIQRRRFRHSRLVRWLGLAALAGGGAAAFVHCSGKPELAPNVLLVSIDMLRPDHMSCYGYAKPTSPNIDRMAAEGVLFENHISSSSWTLPAHAAMFTSLPDWLHGCTDTDKRLCDQVTTLAERFAKFGYTTAGFFSGPYLHPAFGLGQGFQTYVDCCSNKDELDKEPPSKWAMEENAMKKSHQDITNPAVFAALQGWFSKRDDKRPFFMFVHLWDTHFDFIPPPPYDKQFDPDYKGSITGENFFFNPAVHAGMDKADFAHILALYDGEIAWTDSFIGKIRDELERAGQLENTVIAITSDHGTEFFDHGDKGHRKTLYDEVLRIPLVLRFPKKLPARRQVTEETRMIDVGPTLIALAGFDPPKDVVGESLREYIEGRPEARERVAMSDLQSVGRDMRSVRTPGWKFIDDIGRDTFYYFDLKQDPWERQALRDPASEECKKLQGMYMSEVGARKQFLMRSPNACVGPIEHSSPPPQVERQLKGLGYTGKGDAAAPSQPPGSTDDATKKSAAPPPGSDKPPH